MQFIKLDISNWRISNLPKNPVQIDRRIVFQLGTRNSNYTLNHVLTLSILKKSLSYLIKLVCVTDNVNKGCNLLRVKQSKNGFFKPTFLPKIE